MSSYFITPSSVPSSWQHHQQRESKSLSRRRHLTRSEEAYLDRLDVRVQSKSELTGSLFSGISFEDHNIHDNSSNLPEQSAFSIAEANRYSNILGPLSCLFTDWAASFYTSCLCSSWTACEQNTFPICHLPILSSIDLMFFFVICIFFIYSWSSRT